MTDWKNFCRHLGIADVELTQTERRFSAIEATMESLVQWRCKQGRDVNQREEVIKALRAVERMDIVQLLKQSGQDFSEDNFKQLISDFSQWFDDRGLLNRLQVLCIEIVDDIQELKRVTSALH
ncbi:uncharacterized protein [Antedon mediterranea]|uniref:uncharacterized protein n=1 Tax=Antedon mediterranea TaxID=105859 RepID=UPI003AF8346B